MVRNAANTARIPHLLAAFPDARFVHCHRNPYETFAASLERWDGLTQAFSLNTRSRSASEVEGFTLDWFDQVMHRYLIDRRLVPPERMAEVSHDDLRDRPVEVMERLYEQFGLEGAPAVRPRWERLPTEQVWELAGSRPLTPQQRASVAARWEFAFHEWGYPL